MQIIDWLCTRSDGLAHLSAQERDAIINFALLWMYFEAHLVHTKASADNLIDLVDQLDSAGSIDAESVSDTYAYFRHRYWDGSAPSVHVEGLKMKAAFAGKLLPLLSSASSTREQLIACLLIVFRYRNNLFHGTKWLYRLEGQKTNFEHGIKILLAVIAMNDAKNTNI